MPILLKIKTVAPKMIRGLLKGAFPMINGIIEARNNAKGKSVTITSEDGTVVTGKSNTVHSWWSIITQLVIGAFMAYCFITGKITKEDLMDILSQLLNAFSE